MKNIKALILLVAFMGTNVIFCVAATQDYVSLCATHGKKCNGNHSTTKR